MAKGERTVAELKEWLNSLNDSDTLTNGGKAICAWRIGPHYGVPRDLPIGGFSLYCDWKKEASDEPDKMDAEPSQN